VFSVKNELSMHWDCFSTIMNFSLIFFEKIIVNVMTIRKSWKSLIFARNFLTAIVLRNEFTIHSEEKNVTKSSSRFDTLILSFVFSRSDVKSLSRNNWLTISMISRATDFIRLLWSFAFKEAFNCFASSMIWLDKTDRSEKTNFFDCFRDIEMFKIWCESVLNEEWISLLIKMQTKKSIENRN
jgi:hypothetical protein